MAEIRISSDSADGLKAIVLAGGKGSRLDSDSAGLPKAMRKLCGKPILGYVLDALGFLPPQDIIIVVGYMKESIIESFGGLGFRFAVQAEQNGTGDAVKSAKAELDGFGGDVIVCCGDMPLMKRDTYIKLAEYHRNGNLDCAILAGTRSSIVDLSSFGRVRVSSDGAFERVTEARDLTAADKDAEASGTMTPLFNSGVYVFKTGSLFAALEELRPANSQREYYLTDAPAIIARQGGAVQVYTHDLGCQIQGVNTMEDLRAAEEYLNNVG